MKQRITYPERWKKRWPKPWIVIVLFSTTWAFAVATSVLIGLLLHHMPLDDRARALVYFAALAGFVAAPIAWHLEGFLMAGRAPTARFAATFLLLSIGTLGATFLMVAIYTGHYFSQWMEPIYTPGGLLNAAFFLAAQGYSFAIAGVRLFLPVGLVAALAGAAFHGAARRVAR